MTISQTKLDAILALVRQKYPDWTGFVDARFEKDEVTYKQATIAKAKTLLSQVELEGLIAESRYDELIKRLEQLGRNNNLLYQSVPLSGDLSVLYQPTLDRPAFCRAMVELLHGEGPSHERLTRYAEFVKTNNLPNKWTFPTYFLFICHPETEMFVKPRTTKWFLEFVGADKALPSVPTPIGYVTIKQCAQLLIDSLQQFGPRDMVDIQSLIWVCFHMAKEDSNDQEWDAEPFSSLFHDRNEAEWGFDLLKQALERVGCKTEDDLRFALTLRGGKNPPLRLNVGKWLTVGFQPGGTLEVALINDKAGAFINHPREPFTSTAGESDVSLFTLPLAEVRQNGSMFQAAFSATLDLVAQKFAEWKATPYRESNDPRLFAMAFDPVKRSTLLESGLPSVERPMVRETATAGEKFFTEETFALLGGLHADPMQQFYLANKEKFKQLVEEPFQRLFDRVRDRLPPAIQQVMETEKHIFGRIPKNDYGRGGAWDFYWGAFYSKGGKRTKDAQLALWMNHEHLQCSFYIGEYGRQYRERFDSNLQKHRDELVALLEDRLTDLGILFGRPDDVEPPLDHQVTSFAEWVDSDLGYSVRKHFPKERAIAITAADLVTEIIEVFVAVFPLVLLTVDDNPMPSIRAYLNQPAITAIPKLANPEYTLALCAQDTGLAESVLERWKRALERKGQAILYGPPGTGKTFVAEKLARHLIGGGDGFRDLIQFHPSYAYEDFMQGIRPQRVSGGLDYPIVRGRFLDFCDRAARCGGLCVLIIDEINRANLARVFGELMYLLEYRHSEIPLAGGGKFSIPGNVRLIGTMNTADRSIALVDYALRRRFAFLALYPNFEVLRRFHERTAVRVDGLINTLRRVNLAIDDPHYHVGISFFLRDTLPADIADVWQMEIEPYLEEYFFDQRSKFEQFRWDNVKAEIGL